MKKNSKKKNKQHFYGNKKRRISSRFFYNFFLFIIIALGVFMVISIYFSAVNYVERSNMISEKKEMQFMFIDNFGIQHDINQDSKEHGADSKRDYLFKDYSTGELISTGIYNNTGNYNTGNLVLDEEIEKEINTDNQIVKNDKEAIQNDKEIIDNNKVIDSNNDKNVIVLNTSGEKKVCIAPRGRIIKHGESVLAYEQRQDSPDVCNIQRRICDNGKLGGKFEQKSCKTNVPYEYTRGEVISYNQKKIDPLVQPGKELPINKGADFDTDGKINGISSPNTIRNNDIDDSLQSGQKTVEQTDLIIPNCISPWGGIVLNGQFVKAYRYKNGFINHPCEVQLRPCMQGDLEGSYKNASCKHRDISFEDFLNGYFDKEKPSMQRIIETLNKDIPENEVQVENKSIWNMISNLWN